MEDSSSEAEGIGLEIFGEDSTPRLFVSIVEVFLDIWRKMISLKSLFYERMRNTPKGIF